MRSGTYQSTVPGRGGAGIQTLGYQHCVLAHATVISEENQIPASVQICYLGVGLLEGSVWSHVLDDISQNGVHLSLLSGETGLCRMLTGISRGGLTLKLRHTWSMIRKQCQGRNPTLITWPSPTALEMAQLSPGGTEHGSHRLSAFHCPCFPSAATITVLLSAARAGRHCGRAHCAQCSLPPIVTWIRGRHLQPKPSLLLHG